MMDKLKLRQSLLHLLLGLLGAGLSFLAVRYSVSWLFTVGFVLVVIGFVNFIVFFIWFLLEPFFQTTRKKKG